MPSSAFLPGMQLSLRAAIAAGLAVGIAQLLRLQYPLYALIAAVIVTDLAPTETRQQGLRRLLGTVLGATVGAVLSHLLRPGAWAVGLSILIAMLLSNILRLEGAAKVTGYVAGIVVLEHGGESWAYALYRLIETVLGIGVAVLVSFVPKLIRIDEPKQQET